MFCNKVKEFLLQHGVNFTEKDVSIEEALQELERLHIMTTPLVIFRDEVIVGYDKNKLLSLIQRIENK